MSVPGWAAELSTGADPALVARAVRMAGATWAGPGRVREAVAACLDTGATVSAAAVFDALERAGALPGRDETATVARGLAGLGARVAVVGEPGYPRRLALAWPELGAPLWLFVRGGDAGRLPEGAGAVAVVGTRRPTLDGLATARELGRVLAGHGAVVVSGMARGIDQAAHQGALDAGGATVAVLGTGLDVDYPYRDGPLRDAVAAAGGLVTEYRPGTKPHARNFLARNRIIAGLADATVVVEGRARSGALQTARLAAAQGREVLAVPGSLHQPASRAPLDLIRDGATPLCRLTDVLDLVGGGQGRLELDGPSGGGPAGAATPAGLGPAAVAVHGLLGPVPATPDALARASGQPVAHVLAAVAELSARGLAATTPRGVVAAPPGSHATHH